MVTTMYDDFKRDPKNFEKVTEMATKGYTQAEVASCIGISARTVTVWKKTHKEFREALLAGNQIADQKVEQSLYNRALGFEREKVTKKTRITEAFGEEVTVTEEVVYYPPDTTAMIFWLKNRKPEVWQKMSPILGQKHIAERKRIEALTKLAEKELEEDSPIGDVSGFIKQIVKAADSGDLDDGSST